MAQCTRKERVDQAEIGGFLKHAEGYSLLSFEPIWLDIHGENASGIFSVWESLGTLSPYLEVS
jgi:hypothetical protein